jgi:hypothetical protein
MYTHVWREIPFMIRGEVDRLHIFSLDDKSEEMI